MRAVDAELGRLTCGMRSVAFPIIEAIIEPILPSNWSIIASIIYNCLDYVDVYVYMHIHTF